MVKKVTSSNSSNVSVRYTLLRILQTTSYNAHSVHINKSTEYIVVSKTLWLFEYINSTTGARWSIGAQHTFSVFQQLGVDFFACFVILTTEMQINMRNALLI